MFHTVGEKKKLFFKIHWMVLVVSRVMVEITDGIMCGLMASDILT